MRIIISFDGKVFGTQMKKNKARYVYLMEAFDRLGYRFCPERSTDREFVFIK